LIFLLFHLTIVGGESKAKAKTKQRK